MTITKIRRGNDFHKIPEILPPWVKSFSSFSMAWRRILDSAEACHPLEFE
jgi:hypothetical protein